MGKTNIYYWLVTTTRTAVEAIATVAFGSATMGLAIEVVTTLVVALVYFVGLVLTDGAVKLLASMRLAVVVVLVVVVVVVTLYLEADASMVATAVVVNLDLYLVGLVVLVHCRVVSHCTTHCHHRQREGQKHHLFHTLYILSG